MNSARAFRLRLKALGSSIGLSLLFVIVYGSCNWIASHRPGVGMLFFEWERAIPFVPFMILPYLSMDLFFLVAPFLCRNERDLAIFSKRIVVAIFVAGICFLLFPFRFAFERPHADGWLGSAFDWFRNMDQPVNLMPSLHIAFLTILSQHYVRHTRGLLRGAVLTWFVLIGLSTLLTYQHHFLDVVTGFVLGVYCLYFIREPDSTSARTANSRVGLYYSAGAIALSLLGVWFWPWGALLLWPAVALGIVAVGYFGLGGTVFRKTGGRLPWSTQLVLVPCLLGQRLSVFYYQYQCRPWDKVTPEIWIGRVLNDREANEAVRLGVTAVLDLTAEFSEPEAFRALIYCNIPVLDLTAPTTGQLRKMAEFIGKESKNGIVYVHCKIGYSRTAAAVAAYLLESGRAGSVAEAIEQLCQIRPSLVVRPEIRAALEQWFVFLSAKGAIYFQPGATPQDFVSDGL